MKKFSAFLKEAKKSLAAQEAEKLQLTHVGYGKFADVRGNVTHMSKAGKLIKLSPQEVANQNGTAPPEEEGGEGQSDQGPISITFGRFNPPTLGHEALIKKVASSAKNGEYRIYPSRTEDPKKNPLDVGSKIGFMKQAYPDHADAIQNNEEMKTIFDVLKTVGEEGYSEVNIVVGGDRVSEFTSLATKYNGNLYNFDQINVVSAGDRDPDAADNDGETFVKGLTKSMSPENQEKLFKAVQKGMQVQVQEDFNEVSYHLYEIAPKLDGQGLREAYFDGKIFKEGSIVENINTGILSKIVSRGSNYVISIDEHDNIFRGWLKDIVEVKDYVNPSSREWGTDSLTDYVKKLTPGEFVKKINKKDKTSQ